MKHIIAVDNSVLNASYCVQYGWQLEEIEPATVKTVREIQCSLVAYTSVTLYTESKRIPNEKEHQEYTQSEVVIYEYMESERDVKKEGRITIELLEFLESQSRTLLDLSLV